MKFLKGGNIFFVVSFFVLLAVVFSFQFHIFTARAQSADDVAKRQAELQAQLDQTEKEIAQWTITLNAKKQETASIQRDAEILAGKIAQAKLVIIAKNLAIQTLGKDITAKEQTIGQLNDKIGRGKESLGDLIRKTNEMDQYSVAEVALSNKNVSDFFSDVDVYSSIEKSMADLFADIRDTKKQTETERDVLNQKKDQETDAKAVIETQKAQVEKNQAEKQVLLNASKTQEKTYSQILADKQAKAAQIRSALFSLRDSAAIPFGKALTYANEVQKKTGVRPAFLLAILTQETNLGANIGTCNRPGDPPEKQWRAIMPGQADIAAKKSRRDDESAFLRITKALGFDPDSMPLSCPWKGGWGGAMGPSQFIPTTWEVYQTKIAAALGKSVVNPWDPEDAFMASGIYLSELGAGAATFTAERTAALKYYAGGNWAAPANAFYGDGVMAKAANIQTNMIDPLQGF